MKRDGITTVRRLFCKALLGAVVLFAALGGGLYAQGLTPSGILLTNRAVGFYSLDGQTYKVESNQVTTEVKALYGFTIKADAPHTNPFVAYVAPGTEVLLPFTVTNTGNAADSYALGITIDPSSSLVQHGDILIYADSNGNGLLEAGEASVLTTKILAPNETAHYLVVFLVKDQALADQFMLCSLTGRSVAQISLTDEDNWRKIIVSTDAVLTISKSAASGTIAPNAPLYYSISVVNRGRAATTPRSFATIDTDGDGLVNPGAAGILIADPLPANTHLSGQYVQDFPLPHSAAGIALYGYTNNNWSTSIVAAFGGIGSVDKVGLFIPGSLGPGEASSLNWVAIVDALPSSESIANTASAEWADAAGPKSIQTNTVVTPIRAPANILLGPRNDPAGTASGSYKTPDLVTGPYTISFGHNISTADFVDASASTSMRIVFWNTLQNNSSLPDAVSLQYDWIANPLPGVLVRLLGADGLTPIAPFKAAGPTAGPAGAASVGAALAGPTAGLEPKAFTAAGDMGPIMPGARYTFMVEVLVPFGTAPDALNHDLQIQAVSKKDATVIGATTNRLRFGGAVWTPFAKSATPGADILPGAVINYSIDFGNASALDIANVTIFDTIPLELLAPTGITTGTVTGLLAGVPHSIPVTGSFRPNAPPDPPGNRGLLVWIFPSIPAGFTGTLHFAAQADPALPDGTPIRNRASILSAGYPTGITNTTNNFVMQNNRIVVEKTAEKSTVNIGSSVRFSLRIRNASTSASLLSPVSVQDTLPLGMQYVAGSARLDGKPFADPVLQAATNTIVWADLGEIAPAAVKELSYAVLARSGTKFGENVNSAFAQANLVSGTTTKSAIARARVIVYDTLANNSQTLIGRVFYDLNDNGLVDADEPGLPGVRIYLENGTYTISDSQGKYHFEDIKAGTHVIKVDTTSLPQGVQLMAPLRIGGLGKPDSTLIDLKMNELYKANFRVAGKHLSATSKDLSAVAKTLPESTVQLEQAACTGLRYTLQPSKNTIYEDSVEVRIDKAAVGPLRAAYLVILPADTIDMDSVRIGAAAPFAAFSFEKAFWVRLTELDGAFDAKSYDANSGAIQPPAFDRGKELVLRYLAKHDSPLVHYLVGIGPQDAISVVGEELPEATVDLEVFKSHAARANSLAATYQMIEQAAAAKAYTPAALTIKKPFGIISPTQGEVYWLRDKIKVVTRFPQGAVIQLVANGEPVSLDTVGRKVLDNEDGINQYDFIGVPLKAGKNILEFSYIVEGQKPFVESLTVAMAGSIVSVVAEPRPDPLYADGKTEPEIFIQPLDKEGLPLPEGSFITLSMDTGRFVSEDENPQQQGFQRRILHGGSLVRISAAQAPTTRTITVLAGQYEGSIALVFKPYMRPWIITGYAEGSLSWTAKDITKADAGDDFKIDGRMALFAKGTIFDRYLLTLAIDTMTPERENKLFKQLNPDKNYPLYGDASVQQYDAESATGKFVKIERDKNYLMYGDYNTAFGDTTLASYNRSFTGAKLNVDEPWLDFKAFWTKTDQSFVKDEIRGAGLSGYYYASRKNIVENSDKVVLETRSAHDPSTVLQRRALQRYTDYWIDYAEGSLLFRQPVQSSDPAGNPIFIVLSYETRESGAESTIYGIRPKLKLFDKILQVGATFIGEDSTAHRDTLVGVDAQINILPYITLRGEIAWSDVYDRESLLVRHGQAQTLSFNVDLAKDLQIKARYYSADKDFRNPGLSGFAGAIEEYGFSLSAAPDQRIGVFLDALYKENLSTGATFGTFGVQTKFRPIKPLEILTGARYVDLQASSLAQRAVVGKVGLGYDLGDKITLTAFVEKVLGGDELPLSGLSSAGTLFDRFTSTSASASPFGAGYLATGTDSISAGFPDKIFVGVEYNLMPGTKFMLGQEWLGGKDFFMGRTLFGVRSQVWDNTNVYANYGIENTLDTPRSVASFGMRSKLEFDKVWSADFGLDSLYSFAGMEDGNFIAPTIGAQYLSDSYKHLLKVEARFGASNVRNLIELSSTGKLDRGLSYMAKGIFAFTAGYDGTMEQQQHTANLGLAYRPLWADRLNLLTRAQLSYRETAGAAGDLKLTGSVEANWQPVAALTVNGKYAMKWQYRTDSALDEGEFLDLYSLRLLYDIDKNFDAGVYGGIMPYWMQASFDYYAGVELGYKLTTNLYIALGWNFKGLEDKDLVDNTHRSTGLFLTLRYKFDEGTFGLGQ